MYVVLFQMKYITYTYVYHKPCWYEDECFICALVFEKDLNNQNHLRALLHFR